MNVSPGTTFEWTTDKFAAGSTVGVRIRDGQGADFLARTTSGVTEDVTVGTACVKRRTFTAPTVAGQFWIVADDGTDVDVQEIVVTDTFPASPGTSNLYVTEDEIKNAASLLGETFMESELDIIRPAACRAIDRYKRTRFYPSTGTRYYTARPGANSLPIFDLNTLTALEIDADADGTWETEWTANVDFYLAPVNNPADGLPYNRILLNDSRSPYFPTGRNAIKVTGSWGYAETPSEVKLAAAKLCVRELAILRNAPTGVVVASEVAVRIGSVYRDIAYLLDNLNPDPDLTSVQLG